MAIKARLSTGTFVIGIDAENIRRMKAGEPMYIDLTVLGGKDSFLLMVGDTLADVKTQLESSFGDLPPPMADPQPGPRRGH